MECPGGGIGRRARFRCVCRKACRFDSCPGHWKQLLITWFSAVFILSGSQRVAKNDNTPYFFRANSRDAIGLLLLAPLQSPAFYCCQLQLARTSGLLHLLCFVPCDNSVLNRPAGGEESCPIHFWSGVTNGICRRLNVDCITRLLSMLRPFFICVQNVRFALFLWCRFCSVCSRHGKQKKDGGNYAITLSPWKIMLILFRFNIGYYVATAICSAFDFVQSFFKVFLLYTVFQ